MAGATNPSAFPHGGLMQDNGMTLRDYFAAQALAGILANNSPYYPEAFAKKAYEHADEMLKARGGG